MNFYVDSLILCLVAAVLLAAIEAYFTRKYRCQEISATLLITIFLAIPGILSDMEYLSFLSSVWVMWRFVIVVFFL